MTIDFHAHVHPGADHGCRDTATARAQLELARDAGMDTVVTVSHYYPMRDSLQDYLQRRRRAVSRLAELNGEDLPRLMYGTEVSLCPGLEKLKGLDELTVGGTRVMLVEMPFERWSAKLLDTLESIRSERGIVPLLAHVDRYPPSEIEPLLLDGYAAQVNIEGFASFFGRRRLTDWAERGFISALGSDIHGASVGYKHLQKAKNALGGGALDAVMARSARLLDIEEQK